MLSDDAILREVGARLAAARLALNLTQAKLADEAGISTRTLVRLEAGEVATQLSGFVRVCRALGLLDRLDAMLPEGRPGPIEQLKLEGRRRRRASSRKTPASKAGKWKWGDAS